MNETIYAIYDKESGIALKPFIIARNDVAPVREFHTIANNPETIIHQHAKDFELIAVGQVNLETLALEGIVHRTVAQALDMQSKKD